MLKMAVGHSDDVDPNDAIAAAIEQCRLSLGAMKPQAGILFATFDGFDLSLVSAVREAFQGVNVMGSTSAGGMSSVNGYQEDSVTLALFASDTVDVTVGFGAGLGDDVEAACQTAARQALAATKREPKVCIIVTETTAADPQRTLEALSNAIPEGVVVVGGGSAQGDVTRPEDQRRPRTIQFANEQVAEDAVAVLLFSGPVAHSAAVGTGWKAIGPKGTVTRSDYGAIHEIDNHPAMEFLASYLDATGPPSLGNPLAVFEAGTDEFYLRVADVSDPKLGSVNVMGHIPAGAQVQLTTADTEDMLAGTKDALSRACEGFPAGSRPEAALIFSCVVRKLLLGSKTRIEAELAQSVLGDSIPVCGTYCFGEVGPIKGAATSRLLNETFVALLLGT
jgi:hypothetical protein